MSPVLGSYIRTSTSKDYSSARTPSNFAGVRFWTREILQLSWVPMKKRLCVSVHSLKQFIYLRLRLRILGSRTGRLPFSVALAGPK